MALFSPPPPVSSMCSSQRISASALNMTFQLFPLAVVVLVAGRNKLEFLLPLVAELRKVLKEVKLGEVRRVGA
jgi:hypothetical protein